MPWSHDLLAACGWVERGVLVHMQPSQQSRTMISSWISWPLTRTIDWGIPSQWITVWLLNFDLPAKCVRYSPKASAGQPGRHACSAEGWKEEKFVTRLFDFHATVTRCSLSVRGMIIWATIKSNQCQMASDWHAGETQALKLLAGKNQRCKRKTLIFKCATW